MHIRFAAATAVFMAAAVLAPVLASAQALTAGPSSSAPSSASFLVTGVAQPPQGQPAPVVRGGGGGIGFGVKGGLLFSSYREAGESYKNNNGWEGGIFFGGNRLGDVGVMGEILYAKKGAKDQSGLVVDNYYLEIPVLIRMNLGSANKNSGAIVYAIGGPVADILLKATQKNLDVKNNYESLDLGLIAGGGVEISRLLIEARLNWGLKNVAKASGAAATDIKTRSFAVLAGLRFN
ncbi:MAG: PorT family protein [Acidobacteria bacterium]|nr:PorT family protein [Acidobacteriota bacterium]